MRFPLLDVRFPRLAEPFAPPDESFDASINHSCDSISPSRSSMYDAGTQCATSSTPCACPRLREHFPRFDVPSPPRDQASPRLTDLFRRPDEPCSPLTNAVREMMNATRDSMSDALRREAAIHGIEKDDSRIGGANPLRVKKSTPRISESAYQKRCAPLAVG